VSARPTSALRLSRVLLLAAFGCILLHELGHFGRTATHELPLSLVFLNSCQSARVGQDSLTGRQLSMCKALREAGVGFVIGMLWSVEDEAAVQVGATFYNNLMNHPDQGPEGAMRETRLAVAIERAWADGSWLAELTGKIVDPAFFPPDGTPTLEDRHSDRAGHPHRNLRVSAFLADDQSQ
jgi:hypothetical protein